MRYAKGWGSTFPISLIPPSLMKPILSHNCKFNRSNHYLPCARVMIRAFFISFRLREGATTLYVTAIGYFFVFNKISRNHC